MLDPCVSASVKARNGRTASNHFARGNFVMSSFDSSSVQSTDAAPRKTWETPVVIVGSPTRDTFAALTQGIDGRSPLGSPYGS